MSRKTKDNIKTKRIKGEKGVLSMLKMADLEQIPEEIHNEHISPEVQDQFEGSEMVEISNHSPVRKNCFPQKQLCLVECFRSTVNQFEVFKFNNVFSMCLSFIVRTSEHVVIHPGCTTNIKTDFIFNSFEPKNFKSLKKQDLEVQFKTLYSQLKYHIWNLDWNVGVRNQKVYAKYAEGYLKDIADKIFQVEVSNYSSSDAVLEPDTHICKIYFYAQ